MRAVQLRAACLRRVIMAKGQVRGNKEAKKPKKDKTVVVPAGTFITPAKGTVPAKAKP
jgi:hypothetical protein